MATTTPSIPELTDSWVTITYLDINGNPYIPTMVEWRLWDDTNKIQLQNWTAITSLGNSNTIHIPGPLNALTKITSLTESHVIIFLVVAPGGAQVYAPYYFNVIRVPDVP